MATIHNNGDIVYNDAQLEKVEIALQKHYANLEPTQDEINEAGESFIKDNEFHSLQEMEIRYPESMDSQVGEEHPLLTTDEIRELQFHEQSLYADNVKEMNTNLANENYMFHCSVINLQQMCGSLQNQVAGFQGHTARLQAENAKLRELLNESQKQQRLLKEQFDQKPREGPDKDPMWSDTEEQHAYLVTKKKQAHVLRFFYFAS